MKTANAFPAMAFVRPNIEDLSLSWPMRQGMRYHGTVSPLSSRAERIIATGRVLLVFSVLLSTWVTSAHMVLFQEITYTVLGVCLIYACSLSVMVWVRDDVSEHGLHLRYRFRAGE